VTSSSQRARLLLGRPLVRAAALGVLALVAAIAGLASSLHLSPTAAALSLSAARTTAHAAPNAGNSESEARVGSTEHGEKAHLASRAPIAPRAARPRGDDGSDLRLPFVAGLAVARRDDTAELASLDVRGEDRCSLGLSAAAPESPGYRAANPVRGPPARNDASI
jgi:hypothetical protein